MTKKYPLKIFAAISAAIVVLAIIFIAIFGVRTSIDLGSGSQLKVQLSYTVDDDVVSGRENLDKYLDATKTVLHEHGAIIDTYFVEDEGVDTFLVVRIAKSTIKNSDSISQEIATKLGIDETRVSSVQKISGYFSSSQLLYIGLALLVFIVLAFFAGWIRYNIVAGTSLVLAIVHNFILSLAIIFLLRVQFSVISLAACLILTIFVVFALVAILEREREISKSKQYADLSYDQKLMMATGKNKWLLAFPAVLLVLCIILLFVPSSYIRLASLSVMLALIVSVYSTIMFVPAVHANLMELRALKQKQKLSKNVSSSKKK
jgi:preprotein translocase subunit SecF